jgi:hypothetical protein
MLPSQGREASSILVPRSNMVGKKSNSQTPKYDFFVAGRWRNRDNVMDLVKKIKGKGYSVYCFLDRPHNAQRIKNDPDSEMANFEKLDWRLDPYVRDVFESDMEGERDCKTFLLLLPAGKSSHIEAGVAYGMGKKCILIGETTEAESLYLIFSDVFPTVEAFITSI